MIGASGETAGELGRSGSGPGEFRAAVFGTSSGDTLFLFDRTNRRLSVFDRDGRFVRAAPAPLHTLALLWLPNTREIVLNANVSDGDRAGLAFHVFDALGNQLRSFGAVEVPVLPTNPWAPAWRRVGLDRLGRIVSSSVLDRFEVEAYTSDGHLEAQYRVRMPEFKPADRNSSRIPPPPATVEAIRSDNADRVWALVSVPDRRWRDGIGLTRVESEKTWKVDWIDPPRYQDTMILILDLSPARIVARKRLDELCRFISPRGELVCDGENPDGSYRLDVRSMA